MLPDYYTPRLAPFDHQREALEMGHSRRGFAYLLEMGLGKSRVLIDDFCLGYRAEQLDGLVVVAPKSVYLNWSRESDENPGELQKWMWEGIETQTYTYRAGRKTRDADARTALMDIRSPAARILVINVEALAVTSDAEELVARFLRAHRSLLVVDESTLIKSHSSKRTKIMIRLARLAAVRRIMTGSPTTGSLADFWSQFEFLSPGSNLLGHNRFSTFQARYCVMREIQVGGRTIKTEVGSQNATELADLVARHSYRRKKKDCLDLPPKEFRRWEVEMTEEQTTVYRELKQTAMAEVRGSEVTTQIVMTQLMRMHQVVCGHVKVDDGRVLKLSENRTQALLDILEYTDEQAVIWAGYRPDADHIVRKLREVYGPDCVSEWHGGVTMDERERGEAEFQAGRRRFMVATSAGARGRTWTAATLVVYYSNSYDLEVREQSEDRTHRIGTIGTVTYYDIVCPDTVDEKIIRALRAKKDVARAVLRDGVEAWI